MELEFIGADHEVTGSCHYLRIGAKNILVDYGMEQGVNVFENAALPVDIAFRRGAGSLREVLRLKWSPLHCPGLRCG